MAFFFGGNLRCLSFPHQHLGARSAAGSPAACPSAGERRARPQAGREAGQGAAPAAARTGRARAEQRCPALPAQRLPCCWQANRAVPSCALGCAGSCGVTAVPAQPRPGHWRAAALAGRAEMLARPQSRLCLRREPLGAIPTTSQARPPSQTPPLLPAPPLPPGGRRRSETVRV